MIERVEVMKYLGIMIDDRLRFSDHCDYMLKKVGKKISFLSRIGNYISAYTRCIIYKTIIAVLCDIVSQYGRNTVKQVTKSAKPGYESYCSVTDLRKSSV